MTPPLTSPDAAGARRSAPDLPEISPEWQVSQGLVPYPEALETMERRVEAIHKHEAGELIWLLEHPPLITSGTSARADDLIAPDRFPVYVAGRGGQYTYHGPGQRIAYVMLDLRKHGQDLRRYIHEPRGMDHPNARRLRHPGRTPRRPRRHLGRPRATAARKKSPPSASASDAGSPSTASPSTSLRTWSIFRAIVPCGISQHGVTSIRELGREVTMAELDAVMQERFGVVFLE